MTGTVAKVLIFAIVVGSTYTRHRLTIISDGVRYESVVVVVSGVVVMVESDEYWSTAVTCELCGLMYQHKSSYYNHNHTCKGTSHPTIIITIRVKEQVILL